jgi:uncharacterized protein YjbJ (UPF0337 family)
MRGLRRFDMNKDILHGKWKELKGSIQRKWNKLTDDDLDEVKGSRTKLAGRIQSVYGIAKEEAERQVKEWEDQQAA